MEMMTSPRRHCIRTHCHFFRVNLANFINQQSDHDKEFYTTGLQSLSEKLKKWTELQGDHIGKINKCLSLFVLCALGTTRVSECVGFNVPLDT